jgi:hypothetical protein
LDPSRGQAIDPQLRPPSFGQTFAESRNRGFGRAEVLPTITFHPLFGLIPGDIHNGRQGVAGGLTSHPDRYVTADRDGTKDVDAPQTVQLGVKS